MMLENILRILCGDIGEGQKEYTFEPFPESVPEPERAPAPAKEPVPV